MALDLIKIGTQRCASRNKYFKSSAQKAIRAVSFGNLFVIHVAPGSVYKKPRRALPRFGSCFVAVISFRMLRGACESFDFFFPPLRF